MSGRATIEPQLLPSRRLASRCSNARASLTKVLRVGAALQHEGHGECESKHQRAPPKIHPHCDQCWRLGGPVQETKQVLLPEQQAPPLRAMVLEVRPARPSAVDPVPASWPATEARRTRRPHPQKHAPEAGPLPPKQHQPTNRRGWMGPQPSSVRQVLRKAAHPTRQETKRGEAREPQEQHPMHQESWTTWKQKATTSRG